MTLVCYLAHPIGAGDSPEALEGRQDNIANALAWLQWLVDHTPWAIAAPWLPYVQRLDESTYRPRGLRDNIVMLERCDLIVLCGGTISPGMQAEKEFARDNGLPCVDLTSFGRRPTSVQSENAAAVLTMRVQNAVKAKPRRVWLPPITRSDLQSLRAIRARLTMEQILPDAVEFLGRVITAAEVP